MRETQIEQVYIEIQNALVHRINMNSQLKLSSIKKIAGVDIAYWKIDTTEYAVCCIVVLDFHTHEVIEFKEYMDVVDVPYIPGCLAFREVPLFLKVNDLLENIPDIYVFDGNGYLHPRHMGLATHAGILIQKPTIGIAKSYYKISDVDYVMPDDKLFSYTEIIIDGDVYGRTVRTKCGVKPIFLSIGNMIDLDFSMEILKEMVTNESRIPIPTRLADIMTHRSRKKYIEKE